MPNDEAKCPACGDVEPDCYDEDAHDGRQYRKMSCACGEAWTIVYRLEFEEIQDRRHD